MDDKHDPLICPQCNGKVSYRDRKYRTSRAHPAGGHVVAYECPHCGATWDNKLSFMGNVREAEARYTAIK